MGPLQCFYLTYAFAACYVVYKIMTAYDGLKSLPLVQQELCTRVETDFQVDHMDTYNGRVFAMQKGSAKLWAFDSGLSKPEVVKHWNEANVVAFSIVNSTLYVMSETESSLRLTTYTIQLSENASQVELVQTQTLPFPEKLSGLVGSVAPLNSTHVFISTIRSHPHSDDSIYTAFRNWKDSIFYKRSHIYLCSLQVTPAICSLAFSGKRLVGLRWDDKVLIAADTVEKRFLQLKLRPEGNLKLKSSAAVPLSPNDVAYDQDAGRWYVAGTSKLLQRLYSSTVTGGVAVVQKPRRSLTSTDLLTEELMNDITSIVKVNQTFVLASEYDTAVLLCRVSESNNKPALTAEATPIQKTEI